MSWVKKNSNYSNEESEEDKQNRLAKEKATVEQNKFLVNMVCPICGNHEFNKSSLIAKGGDHNSYVEKLRSYYRVDDKTFYNKIYKVNSIMCLHCGYIMDFADMGTMNIEKLKK